MLPLTTSSALQICWHQLYCKLIHLLHCIPIHHLHCRSIGICTANVYYIICIVNLFIICAANLFISCTRNLYIIRILYLFIICTEIYSFSFCFCLMSSDAKSMLGTRSSIHQLYCKLIHLLHCKPIHHLHCIPILISTVKLFILQNTESLLSMNNRNLPTTASKIPAKKNTQYSI